jgi:hypothetical protein
MPFRLQQNRRMLLACLAMAAVLWFGLGPFLAGHGHEGQPRHTCNLCRSVSLPSSGALACVEIQTPTPVQSELRAAGLLALHEPLLGSTSSRAPPAA